MGIRLSYNRDIHYDFPLSDELFSSLFSLVKSRIVEWEENFGKRG